MKNAKRGEVASEYLGINRLRKSGVEFIWFIFRSPDAKKPELPKPPMNLSAENEIYIQECAQRKATHDEVSKTIRRVYYTLIAASLFCVLTLSSSLDEKLLTPTSKVTLPVINFELGFLPFLIVGPIVLITLTIYLHIFVVKKRTVNIPVQERLAILPNFSSWSARTATLAIYYWITPITLAVFAWKSQPTNLGLPLLYTFFVVTGILFILQIRRCPSGWVKWAVPLLLVVTSTFVFYTSYFVANRQLDLFKADLHDQDLRNLNLSEVYLVESQLNGANLTDANLMDANLTGADMSDANLTGANLIYANLLGADMRRATFYKADLSEAKLDKADLRESKFYPKSLETVYSLNGADLRGLDLSGIDLTHMEMEGAKLNGAILEKTILTDVAMSEAKLIDAKLSGAQMDHVTMYNADLTGANLSGVYFGSTRFRGVDLSGADLSGANLSDVYPDGIQQQQLDKACGDEKTRLPPGMSIKPCAK